MIEWFLSPSSDNERSIQYAMKLYGANQVGERILDRFLTSDDKALDRRLKELQARKLAGEMGLDWKRYMSDDAAEENKTTQAAIAYGAMNKAKPRAVSIASYMRQAPHDAQWIADLERGPAAMAKNVAGAFGVEGSVADLMRKFGAGNMKPAITKIARYATFL